MVIWGQLVEEMPPVQSGESNIGPLYSIRQVVSKEASVDVYFAFLSAELAKLREKFEEDKRKIASMRMQRKFKPY